MAMQEPGRTKGFPCKHCGTVCSNMPSLLEHMDSHSQQEEDRKFKCDECGRGYRHAGSLANHKKTHELGSFQCPVCARKLSNPLALKSHLRIHTSQKKYSCMDCGKAFRLATQLATHQKVHLSRQSKRRAEIIPISANYSENLGSDEAGDRPFKCDQCEKSYRHHGSLINHKKSHQVGMFECPICFKQFNNLAALHMMFPNDDEFQEHIQMHNSSSMSFGHIQSSSEGYHGTYDHSAEQSSVTENVERRFKCQVCGKSYRHAGSLINHKRSHQTGIYQCSICRKTYPHMAALRSHIRIHRAHPSSFNLSSEGDWLMMALAQENKGEHDNGGSFHEQYDSTFPQERTVHLPHDEHLMERHMCADCGETFADIAGINSGPSSMSSLEAEKEEDPGERQQMDGGLMICSTCGESFAKKQDMLAHQLSHHKAQADDAKHYKCDQCGRAYRHAGSLLNHKKSHKTGVFRCMVCQKRFYNLLALKNHQRTHFDVKRHTCNECGKAFKIQKQLLNHLRIHKENKAKIQELNNQIQALMQMNGSGSEGGMHSLNAPANQAATTTRRKRRPTVNLKKPSVKSEGAGDPRPYSCDQCGRTYRHAGSLVNHKNSHKTGEYYCSVCNNTYSNQLAMKNHLRIHFSVKKHSCQHCGKAFRGKKQLSNHICAHLRKDMPGGVRGSGRRRARNIKCKQCRLIFVSADQLTAHTCGMSLKKEERPFTCNICNRSYRHAGSLLNHKNTHKSGHFSCTFCSKPFSNPMALRNHTRIHTQKKKHVCLTCGKAFRLASILHNHQKVHTRVASHFSCPECGKSFQGKSGLKRHRCQSRGQDDSAKAGDSYHRDGGGDKCFMCDLCGRSYRHSGSLLNHKKTHSENLHHCTLCLQTFPDPIALHVHSQMKRHCCPDCGKTFCLVSHLQSHMEVHSKERTLVCSPCHQSFPNPASYQQHQDLHHRAQGHYQQHSMQLKDNLGWGSELDQPSHVCEHCGRTYRHAGSLLNHKNSHKTGSFFCSVCQKEFTNLMALKNHRRIHTEPKRYQCLECGKAFRVSTQLICHRRMHTKEKPFSCLLCDKSFSSKSNLRHHQKMHQSGAQVYESSFSMDANSFMDLDMGSFL
ncbi:unnamed protein product [Oncorhynchus mykiss]|uniref:C2H2-type domain-containing protein n=1 Tax=Oncorhynchus mykiss TaxID=8022 RepID=A0A060VV47_ONCMY|nr:unnamed protein product [Oncorhynchus mykiss]